jgi:hypothetical protein
MSLARSNSVSIGELAGSSNGSGSRLSDVLTTRRLRVCCTLGITLGSRMHRSTRSVLALAAAAFALCAAGGARAALETLTVPIDVYDTSAVAPAGETLATVTVKDILGGGVSVDVSLNQAIYFASTGGNHITFAFNVDTPISYAYFTFTNPLKTDFTFVTNKNAGPTFGTFTDGIDGTWSGTNNHFAGPIDFTIAGLSVSDFTQNSKDFWAIVDVLGSKGTGEAGGQNGTIMPSAPEPST